MSRRISGLNAKGLMSLAVDNPFVEDDDSVPEIPGYEVGALLGRGAAGLVYEAIQIDPARSVAIKWLSAEHTADVLQRERISREAAVMASISHPNVVEVYELIEIDYHIGIAMELVTGKNLRDYMQTNDLLPLDKSVKLFEEIASALISVHDAGLTHRDLKPENILLTDQGSPKVTDFGIAFAEEQAGPRLTLTGMTMGTVGYMSPEQAEGLPVDARSDIYSLGVVFHEILTGSDPESLLEPPKLLRRELSDHINDAIIKALSPLPDDRFSSMEEFSDAVIKTSKRGWNPFRKGK